MLTANDFAQGVFITFFTKMSLIVDFLKVLEDLSNENKV